MSTIIIGVVTANKEYTPGTVDGVAPDGVPSRVYFEVGGFRLIPDREFVGELPPVGFHGKFSVRTKDFKSKSDGQKGYKMHFLLGVDSVLMS